MRNSVSNNAFPGCDIRRTGLTLYLPFIIIVILSSCTSRTSDNSPGNSHDQTFTRFLTDISPGGIPAGGTRPDSARPQPWFAEETGHYMYTTHIDVLKNHFSGITVIKKFGKGNFRIIMMTETGLKVLDFEFFADSAPQIHYIMESMDKKILIRTLTKDISTILMNQIEYMQPLWHTNISQLPEIRVAKYTVGKESVYYIFDTGKNTPSEGITMRGRRPQTITRFFGEDTADSIILDHYNINLSVSLFRIKE